MSMEIPGLIAKKDSNSNLTEAERQAKRDSFEAFIKNWKPNDYSQLSEDQQKDNALKQIQAQYPNQKVTRVAQYGSQSKLDQQSISNYMTGVDPYYNPNVIPLTIGDPIYQQPFDYKKFGGLKPSKGVGEYQDMADYLQHMMKPVKSEFEVLLDAMFDRSEKEQFLITLGFEFSTDHDGEDWMQRTVAGLLEKCKTKECFDKIFLREMTIKFKNLLISKNTLKMKI